MTPLVSVLIPLYNSEKWVAETIQSVLTQSWRNIEVIVVDDGSTDNSYLIAKTFESAILKVIRQENRGCGAARNRAYQEAQGKYIQLLDADDLLGRDKIERQVKRLEREGHLKCVASGEWARFVNSCAEAEFIKQEVWADMPAVEWLVCSWNGGGMMPCHGWLIPRILCEIAGRFNEKRCPDAEGEWITRLLSKGDSVLFCKGAQAFYRSGLTGSLSRATSQEMLAALYHSAERSIHHLLSLEDTPRTRKACANLFQLFVYSSYPQLPELVKDAEEKIKILGGSSLPTPLGGKAVNFLTRFVNWKLARKAYVTYKSYIPRKGI